LLVSRANPLIKSYEPDDGSFVPVHFPFPAFQVSVDSVTQGLVAVMQSDSNYFIASTISDDGHAGPAVNYPCCSVTPSGVAYNSADSVYFADIDTAPPPQRQVAAADYHVH
jgi:hypothetical protein